MRVVYDYGYRPISTGPRTTPPNARTRETPVMIIHVGEGARRMRQSDGSAGETAADQPATGAPQVARGGRPEGIPVPGTSYMLTAGEDADRLDRSVRAHERLHQAALGPYAESAVLLATRRGPDGRSYAVGGRIGADLSPVPDDPRATLRKANAVRRAALAPGSPSAADMRVAAEAYRLAQDAKEDLRSRGR